jgi:ribonucleoside-diphosphate reductase alpha chain
VVTDKKKHGSSSESAPAGDTAIADLEAVLSDKQALEARVVEVERELTDLRAKADQPVRRRMPETRVAINHKFEIAGHKGYLTVGMFENGQPGELFIQMNKEGSTIGGLMDTIATLTSIALQYGVPLESLVKKFAYQRFEPSGFTKNPDIRNATSITDYVFRWLGCQFIKGYKEATSPNRAQADLPMKELAEIDKKAINRPVAELPRETPGIIDVITHKNGSEGEPHIAQAGSTHAERVQTALGNMYMDITCSNCGSSKVIRAGACGCCTECGTSQGCS